MNSDDEALTQANLASTVTFFMFFLIFLHTTLHIVKYYSPTFNKRLGRSYLSQLSYITSTLLFWIWQTMPFFTQVCDVAALT